jgi:hypothetical protein
MRMRMADGFEHFQLAGFNDGNGLRAFNRREALQKIFNGFAAFQGVNQILQGDTRADKNGCAAHDFRVRVNDAFQIFHGHNMVKIPLAVKLSSAKMDVMRAQACHQRPEWEATSNEQKRPRDNGLHDYGRGRRTEARGRRSEDGKQKAEINHQDTKNVKAG